MGKLTVVTGPPAGGKSTYVHEHATPGDVVVDFDKLAQALGSPSPHDSPAEVRRFAHAARDAVIDALLAKSNGDAWVIHTTPTPVRVADYENAGAEFVLVDPGMDAALAQAAADGRPEWTEQAIRDWYDKREEAEAMNKSAIEVRKRFSVTKLDVEPATEDGLEGVFTAHVSAFGVLDSQGDVVDKGAYAGSVAKFKDGGKILLYWMHDYGNIMSLIGELTAIEETATDLLVSGALDVADNPVAAKVFHHMQLGRLKEFSVGGMVDDWSIEGSDSDAVVHIKNLDLWEVSVCFKGANPATELLSLKSHVMKQALAPLELPDVEHDYTPGPARLTNSTQALLGLLPLV